MAISGATERTLSLNPRQTLVEMCFFVGLISLGLVCATSLQSRRNAKTAAKVWAITAALVAVVGVVQAQLSPDAIFGFFTSSDWQTVFGPFINNNHASVAIGACVPFGIYLAQHSKGPEELTVWLLATGAMLTGTVMTGSRSGLLIAVYCLTIFFINQSDRHIRRLSGLIALVLGVGVVLYGVEDALTRWTTLIEPDFYVQNGLDTGRLSMYRAALPLVWSAPLVGAGAGGFAEAFATRLDTVFYSAVEQAHNDPLELVIEYGFALPVIWTALIIIVLVQRFIDTRRQHHRGTSDVHAAFLACASGIAAYSLWDFPLRIGALAALFVMSIGALVGVNNRDSKRLGQGQKTALRIFTTGLAFLTCLISLFLVSIASTPTSVYGDANATTQLAAEAEGRNDLDLAATHYRQALQQRLFAPRVALKLAAVELRRGEVTSAKAILETAAYVFPTDPYVLLNLARIHRSEGRSLEAAELYQTLLEFPSPSVSTGRAWLEEALSNHPEPYRVPDLILPSRPERWCQAASIVTQKFGKEAGEVMYHQATLVDLDCNYQYAAALWQWKRPQEAMAVLDELPKLPQHAYTRIFKRYAWAIRGGGHAS